MFCNHSVALLIASTLLCVSTEVGAQNLLCSTEFASGISFDRTTRRWAATTFRPDAKYVVVKSEHPNAKYEVRQLGSGTAVAWCKSEYSQSGLLQCDGIFQEFRFNKTGLRFLRTYTAGYWDEKDISGFDPKHQEGDSTPAMSAGTCATF